MKFWLAKMDYGATGEGLTVAVALGDSAAHAQKTLERKLDPYFHGCIEVSEVEEGDPVLAPLMPPKWFDTAKKIRAKYGECIYDLSAQFH